jgi:hypothetical protein
MGAASRVTLVFASCEQERNERAIKRLRRAPLLDCRVSFSPALRYFTCEQQNQQQQHHQKKSHHLRKQQNKNLICAVCLGYCIADYYNCAPRCVLPLFFSHLNSAAA